MSAPRASAPSTAWGGRPWRWFAAALAGAGGLGLEVVVLGAAGLSLGFSRANALGLGAYVAGWSLGAFAAGRSRRSAKTLLIRAGAAALLAAALVPAWLIHRGSAPGGELLAAGLGLAAVFACALPQGVFLPVLARRERGVAGLFAANLLGSVAGATWIGFELVAAEGRLVAGGAAGVLTLLAAGFGSLGSPGSPETLRSQGSRGALASPVQDAPELGTPASARIRSPWLIVGAATFWTIGLEWCLLRLAVLWMGSREAALSSVLAASLLALAAGAALLPALIPRKVNGLAVAIPLAVAGLLWPFLAGPTLTGLLASGASPLTTALVLVAPPLLPLGAVIPLLHRALRQDGRPSRPGRDGGARLGGLLLHEGWGALLAGPLVHWLLVPQLGLGGALASLGCLALVIAWALPRRTLVLALSALLLAPSWYQVINGGSHGLAARSPALSNPAVRVVALDEDAEFAVAVIDDGLLGERTLLTDTFRAAGDGPDYAYMRLLGHLPILLHPNPRRVAVAALGTGTTVGAVALHPRVEQLEVLELSRAVVDYAEHFVGTNGGALEDPRVRVRLGDSRRTLATHPGSYDVVTIEPLLPDSPFGVYLYTEGFYAVARRALAPGGLFCQWVPPHALEPHVFAAVLDAFRASFPWSGAWVFGSQVVLLGGEGPPATSAARFGRPGDPLHAALSGLGLETPAGIAARFVSSGAAWPPSARRLTDADPWIVFPDKPGGAAVLSWLPQNLRSLAETRAARADWLAPDVGGRRAALGGLLEARIEHAAAEFDLVTGVRGSAEGRSAVDAILLEVLPVAARDPEVRAFVEQLRYLRGVRDGVARLRLGDAAGAVEALTTAVELRGQRADVHLYMATALQALGLDQAGEAALAEALERCPRLRETPVWARAEALGLQEDPGDPVVNF